MWVGALAELSAALIGNTAATPVLASYYETGHVIKDATESRSRPKCRIRLPDRRQRGKEATSIGHREEGNSEPGSLGRADGPALCRPCRVCVILSRVFVFRLASESRPRARPPLRSGPSEMDWELEMKKVSRVLARSVGPILAS